MTQASDSRAMAGNLTSVGGALRAVDRDLLGLAPDPEAPDALAFEVVPHLCRTDGRFYGGAALAAALAASEAATGRPALWSSTQLVASADLGERIRVTTDVVASGRTVDQVHIRGTVGDRLVFNAVGGTATPRPAGLQGPGQVMPRVPPPEDCADWRGGRHPGGAGDGSGPGPGDSAQAGPAAALDRGGAVARTIGHGLVSVHREAPILTASSDGPERPGHMALWARLTPDPGRRPAAMSPAVLGFLADMVPIACARACGVAGAGTSLDNSLRVGEPVECEWVLLELDAHVSVGGFGHGQVHLWSPDGRMLGTGTQSARLFSFDDFANGRAG